MLSPWYKRSSRILLIALFILTAFAKRTHAEAFTLEQILSAPFPSELIVSPVGSTLAWVFDDQGVDNIFVATAPNYTPRKLTAFDKDDGQNLSALAFGPDGKILVFVRGGAPNPQGQHPNPISDSKAAKQEVWGLSTSGGDPWMLGEGAHPVVSPKGDLVTFVKEGRVFKAPVDGSQKSRPVFDARGKNGSLAWSPDGSRLAFVSQRGDHSFIGVYDFGGDRITWLVPSVDRDRYPVWSPDGQRIAFIRFPGALGDPPRSQELDLPFAIWVVELSSRKGRKAWSSPDASGGFAQDYPAQPLMWGASNRLVFYSEHDGWMHLYTVSAKGGQAKCLTPGEYEVEESSLSPDRQVLIVSSNREDIDRRHLWSVPILGGKATLLTPGQGIEWSPAISAKGDLLVFLCSTARQPAAPAVMRLVDKTRRLIAPKAIPKNFPSDLLVDPLQVVFAAPDGLKIHGQLFLPPKDSRLDKRPGLIFMHGGPIRQMLLGWHMRGYYHKAYAMNQYLASRGYVVLSVNFRSGIGYGRLFRRAPNQGPRGASEYQDIVAGARFLQKLSEVDPAKIGLWGGSYGGYLTALGLSRDSALFSAGVDFHGVHDWKLRAKLRDGGGWGIFGDSLERSAYQSSPVANVSQWRSPVLFIHGDDDRNVDFIQTTDLIQRLREAGRAPVEVLVFPDEVHNFARHAHWVEAFWTAADFFDRFLKRS